MFNTDKNTTASEHAYPSEAIILSSWYYNIPCCYRNTASGATKVGTCTINSNGMVICDALSQSTYNEVRLNTTVVLA